MTSISFAKVVSGGSTIAGTNVYTQQAAPTATATSTTALTGQDVSDYFILTVFTKPYLDAHTLSYPSWRYAYLFWFVLIAAFIGWAVLHQLQWKLGALGASFRKIGMRKISFGKARIATTSQKSRRAWTSMTLHQLFGLAVLLAFTFVMCYVGPDYINPTECMFGGECEYHPVNGDTATSQFRKKRNTQTEYMLDVISRLARRRVARYGWSPLTDPLLSGPNHTIQKGWWESSSRIGLIAYAMLPLSVSLALKQWPMNIFATPFLTNLGIDRTAFWHRWVGRIIWILSTLHTGLWTKQMFIDLDPFNEPTWNVAWKWHRLVAGGIAYVLLTIMVALSFKPLRTRFYELFYYSHILLTLGFLVTIIIHYEALQGWCLLAAGLWGLERLTRLSIFIFLNYGADLPIYGEGHAAKKRILSTSSHESGFKVYNVEKRLSAGSGKLADTEFDAGPYTPYGGKENSEASRSTHNLHDTALRGSASMPVYAYGAGNDEIILSRVENAAPPKAGPYGSALPFTPHQYGSAQPKIASFPSTPQISARQVHRTQPIPRGFALAQILPGRVIKLTLHTPRHLSWRPGQYLMLTLPSIRWWQGHPYSISNAQNLTEQLLAKKPEGEDKRGSEIVLLMSVRQGFTRHLYNSILAKRKRLAPSTSASFTNEGKSKEPMSGCGGVLLRAQTYLPTGSAGRVQWDDYSTVVLVAAGSGITYCLAVLEHLCCEMARRDAAIRNTELPWARHDGRRKKKPTEVNRVRFVWILKDYSHLAWIAPALRRCLDISDPARLRIDLFVTRPLAQVEGVGGAANTTSSNKLSALMMESRTDIFQPPNPRFARQHERGSSVDSSMSDLSQTLVDSREHSGHGVSADSTNLTMMGQADATLADFSVTDMILFDGEEDLPISAADKEISKTVKREGRLRRALSRTKSSGGHKIPKQQELSFPARNASNHPALDAGTSDDEAISGHAPSPPRFPGSRPSNSPAHRYPPAFETSRRESRRSSWTQFQPSDSYSISGESSYSVLYDRRSSTANLLFDGRIDSFDMDEHDREDLNIIAELARSGRPDLGTILDQETQRSQGRIVVGCCGPQALNNVVRAIVAKRISPSRVAKGDPRGQIDLIAEDFAY